jgi:hypothetical protein
VLPPSEDANFDLWPGYLGPLICKHPLSGVGDDAVPALEALTGVFGLVPHWATDTMRTLNADQHSPMNHFHRPADEKRMVAILPPQPDRILVVAWDNLGLADALYPPQHQRKVRQLTWVHRSGCVCNRTYGAPGHG